MSIANKGQSADAHTAPSTPPLPHPPFWRAILIGVLLIPLSTYYGNYAYVVVQALIWGQTALLRGPVFVLFVLTLANLLFRKIARRTGLLPWEMLLIYSMIAVSVCIAGFGQIEFLVNILPAGAYYATSANHYDRFLYQIPGFLTPHDPRVINDFFRGHASMYRADILRDWAIPVMVWSLFLAALTWVTLCLASLVRRQWVDEEKLTFPLVFLPLEMAQGGAGQTPFYRNRLMWAGFILAGLLESVDYLNFLYPSVPYIPIKPTTWHLNTFITQAPWNSIGTFTLAFYPFAIGIAFLLSQEVSFSCWFFYLLTKAENVCAAAWGLNQGGGSAHGQTASPPYLGEQGLGAFLAMGAFLVWRLKKPLIEAARALWDRPLALRTDDPSAPLSPRAALIGAVAGIILLTAFISLIGLPLWVAVLFWILYLLVVLVLTRIIAEAGAGWAFGPMSALHNGLLEMTGSSAVGARGPVVFGYLSWFDSEFRDTPMPHQLEALKLGQETRTPRRQLLWGLLIAAVFSTVVAFWAYLHMYYELGAASAKVRPVLQGVGTGTFLQISNALNNPRHVDIGGLGGMLGGAVVTLGLSLLRRQFVWWPLHPIGYVLAGTQSMEYMWFPFFMAWAVKSLVLRYGGVRIYRLVVPFALGLILGDYIVPTLWGIWGTAIKTQVYLSFPH